MQPWQFFPCFVVFNHTLQAVTEIIIGSFKIFRGQPFRSIALQELSGVRTTRCTPSTCAHSLDGKKEELTEVQRLELAKYFLSATIVPNFKCDEFQDLCNSLSAYMHAFLDVLVSYRCMQLNKYRLKH